MTDPKQKPSAIIVEHAGRDLPAEFIFSVTLDARANDKTLKQRRHGRPHGKGFRRVTPHGVAVASLPGEGRRA